MANGSLRRSSVEIAPGTLAWVARDVHIFDAKYFIKKHTCVLVLGRACEPPEPMVSSTIYALLVSGDRLRIGQLPHCDLLVSKR